MSGWTFLTNHTRVLACVAQQPGVRLREIAACAGITERAAHRIVWELEADGYITRHRVGARNFYEVHPDRPLRHQSEAGIAIGDPLRLLARREDPPAERAAWAELDAAVACRAGCGFAHGIAISSWTLASSRRWRRRRLEARPWPFPR